MEKRLKYFFVIVPLLILIRVAWDSQTVKLVVVKLFNEDAIFANYNSAGKMDGKVTKYIDGNLYGVGNLVNGIKQGWEEVYYPNGKLKSKTFFVNGSPSGKGYVYQENGDLAYSGYYAYGNMYGDWNYYQHNRRKKYLLFDIKRKNVFSTEYQNDGTINKKTMDGFVVSSVFFSIDTKTKKLTILNDHSALNRVSNVRDLMITIANPEGCKLSVNVTVNGKKCDFVKIDDNTLKVANVLNKGKYDIFIESYLRDKNNQVINGINIKESVVVL